MTDGTAPREAAFDAISTAILSAGPADPVIFNCHMGAGRTTTGMVIACLVRQFIIGVMLPKHCMRFCTLLQPLLPKFCTDVCFIINAAYLVLLQI